MRKTLDVANERYRRMQEFCKLHKDKDVVVAGLWYGEFIGQPKEIRATECTFKFVRLLNHVSSKMKDHLLDVPFAGYVTLRELTDEEAQVSISEVYGEVEIN